MVPALSECDPGFEPFEFNVVIAPEEISEKTAGGIILIDQKRETDALATMRGRLVAVSPVAFDYAEFPNDARLPQVGDEVIFAKYAGTLVDGRDGRTYRLCKDRDIAAVVTA